MASFTFANFINTTLASPLSNTGTSIVLASSANLPSGVSSSAPLVITLNDAATRSVFEVVYVTAISGATLTVLRAQEGTLAQSWLVGDYAYSGVTEGQMANLGSGFNNPMTAAGDLIMGGYLGAPTRLAIGTAGYVLTAESGSVSWQPASGGSSSGVSSFNTRTGAVVLNGTDVTTALGYTPYSTAGGPISGNVSIGGTLTVTGVTDLSSLNVTTNATVSGNVSVGGNLMMYGTTTTLASDRRIKSNIQPIHHALGIVESSLQGVEYDMHGEHAAGFIAQDVEIRLPHAVRQSEYDGFTDFRTLDYHQIIPYLAAAIVELHDIVKRQDDEIRRLRK